MDSPLKIGVIGCGSISSTYFKNLMNIEDLSIIACADIDIEKARMIGNPVSYTHLTLPTTPYV